MRRKDFPYYFLMVTTVIGMVLLPFAIVKRSFKDWIIVYLVTFIGNFFSDRYLVTKGYLKYPKKLFPKYKIHLPFDFIQYPLMLLYYNQWTLNSKPVGIFLKLFPFVITQTIIETIASKKTNLIKWKKGWSWYHSLISLMLKMLICRAIIAVIRIINNRKISVR
ncbi:CBO0543 family protein [Bacillus sp. MRMR6]|uniref:CBO0543 family protein n=1 Tax=Bacillus sp. MRMR6 TaxID=1928617 RepID=UPI0009513E36|nr:CBO0543 family protein [Bacillus sp. MRMR6]OLS33448.1 hypothetical protein BTR25_25865 [Bacillus sp. MRMR6]